MLDQRGFFRRAALRFAGLPHGWRATFYTIGMEHSPASATGTGCEWTPWRATQRAAWEALKKVSRDGLDGESFEIPDLTTSDVHPNGPPARVQRDAFADHVIE